MGMILGGENPTNFRKHPYNPLRWSTFLHSSWDTSHHWKNRSQAPKMDGSSSEHVEWHGGLMMFDGGGYKRWSSKVGNGNLFCWFLWSQPIFWNSFWWNLLGDENPEKNRGVECKHVGFAMITWLGKEFHDIRGEWLECYMTPCHVGRMSILLFRPVCYCCCYCSVLQTCYTQILQWWH